MWEQKGCVSPTTRLSVMSITEAGRWPRASTPNSPTTASIHLFHRRLSSWRFHLVNRVIDSRCCVVTDSSLPILSSSRIANSTGLPSYMMSAILPLFTHGNVLFHVYFRLQGAQAAPPSRLTNQSTQHWSGSGYPVVDVHVRDGIPSCVLDQQTTPPPLSRCADFPTTALSGSTSAYALQAEGARPGI